MASTVRAAVLVKPKTLEAREFARPAIGADDALLRIEASRPASPSCSIPSRPVSPGPARSQARSPGIACDPRCRPARALQVIAARAAGARQVVITGLSRDAQKLALARELGPDAVVDVEHEDVVSRVRELTGGGAEVVVGTTPYAPRSLNDAVAIAVRKGRIVVAGLKGLKPTHDLQVDDVIYKELTIRGVLSMAVDETFRAIELIESGRYPFAKMHTQSFPLEKAEEAIHPLAGHVPELNPIHLAIVPGVSASICRAERGRFELRSARTR